MMKTKTYVGIALILSILLVINILAFGFLPGLLNSKNVDNSANAAVIVGKNSNIPIAITKTSSVVSTSKQKTPTQSTIQKSSTQVASTVPKVTAVNTPPIVKTRVSRAS